MSTLDFSRSKALNNIPQKKIEEKLNQINASTDDIKIKNIKITAINRYVESNIPVEYWDLKMEKDFVGDPKLLNKYNEYVADIKNSYITGKSICFAASHGTGKTFTSTSILKKACHKGFACLYSDLSSIVSVLTSASLDEKFTARRELSMVDFLVIDEFDPRFIANDNVAELYARNLENIFRTRSQNKLPTIMCTNSPNIIEAFQGNLKQSLDSLMKGYLEVFPVFGKDFRKRNV